MQALRLYAFLLIALVAAHISSAALGAQAAKRSYYAVANFKRTHPCPSTGMLTGKCPGFIVDHVEPLCAGGDDEPGNMQWQTVPEAKAKDITERARCRALKKNKASPIDKR